MKLLSIVTPTFNRAVYLKNCFSSLRKQTDQRFEWILVDDGSTDRTEEAVSSFQAEHPAFPIWYLRKDNGGKHTALNASHPMIHGDYVLVLDSDDQLTPNAVAEIHRAWDTYTQADVGIIIFQEGYTPDDPFAAGRIEHTPLDMYRNHIVCFHTRDCCDVYRVDAFIRFPYPEFSGESFLSESILWNKMAPFYKIVYINKVIYLADYLEDGLTKAGRAMRIRMPLGGMYAANCYLDRHYPLPLRIKNGLLYNCYGFFSHTSAAYVRANAISPGMALLTRPAGWMLYRFWRKKYGD